ncbi:hypothetical protein L6R50_16725 [Myxococcota bacterium]|nr:hypothetical protein [Myxococcota bacterium]
MTVGRRRFLDCAGWTALVLLAAVAVYLGVFGLEARAVVARDGVRALAAALPEALHMGVPVACLAGTLVAELRAAGRGERAAWACAGAGPLRRALPALAVGLLAAGLTAWIGAGPRPAGRAALGERAGVYADPTPGGAFLWPGGVLVADEVADGGARLRGVRLLPRRGPGGFGEASRIRELAWGGSAWVATAEGGAAPVVVPATPDDFTGLGRDLAAVSTPALRTRARVLEGLGRSGHAERAVVAERAAWAALCPGLALLGTGLAGRRRREGAGSAVLVALAAGLLAGSVLVVLGAAARSGAVATGWTALTPLATLVFGLSRALRD